MPRKPESRDEEAAGNPAALGLLVALSKGRNAPSTEPAESDQPVATDQAGHPQRWPVLAAAALGVVANVLALTGWRLAYIGPAIGFWLIVVHPVYLLSTSSLWRRIPAAERVGYSVAGVILLLYLFGLTTNVLLPAVGISRPLDTIPVLIVVDAINVLLYLFRRRHPAPISWRRALTTVGQRECRVLVIAGACVLLAVLGANRLNNGAGDQLAFIGLAGVVVTLALCFVWRQWLREGAISLAIYLASLAVLLATSLRGWSVTGHDIQLEYLVFQLTSAHGHWSMANFPHNDYNACLSITILPTQMSRILHVYDPDIYKFFFQIFFALCPVLVYTIARRHWSKVVSILGVVYFIGFPVFWEDMAYENRQEIGFLFVCAGVLALSNIWWTSWQRRAGLVIAALGIELSHYSTMYIFLGVLVIAWAVVRLSVIRIPRLFGTRTAPDSESEPSRRLVRYSVGLGTVITLSAILVGWGDVATQTAGPAFDALKSSVIGIVHPGSQTRSEDVLYGLLHGSATPPAELLAHYRQQTLQENADVGSSGYLPASQVAAYPTPDAGDLSLPLTAIGRFFTEHGLSASGMNYDVRQGAAKDEQLFLGVGLIAILASVTLRRRIGREIVGLSLGSIVVLGMITVLPALSVEYGVERAFQEALIVTAPLLAWGSVVVCSLLGDTWKGRVAALACFGFFVSTIGLMPQVLGGYPPQLNLNNSGQYYDVFYTHPQELAARSWLQGKPGVLPGGLQASFSGERFYATAPSDVTSNQVIGDAFPTLVSSTDWLLLGYATVHTGIATLSTGGGLVNYVYPLELIKNNKNLVYNNGGSEIFK